MDIKGIVRELVTTHNTNDPFELCKCLDIMISLKLREITWILWLSFSYVDYPYLMTMYLIICSGCMCPCNLVMRYYIKMRTFHFYDPHTFYCTNKLERQANAFAVELLLPDELIMDHDCTSLCNLAKAVGVPHGLEELKDTGRINFHG